MPGPCNSRKRRQNQAKKEKRTKAARIFVPEPSAEPAQDVPQSIPSTSSRCTSQPTTPPPTYHSEPRRATNTADSLILNENDAKHLGLLKRPCIEDNGDGPHVRDVHEFLETRFAAPPSVEDPLCAQFALEEVLEMLCAVLPEETATIMWYNKSRLKARICPACKRLYRVGDTIRQALLDDVESERGTTKRTQGKRDPRGSREQEISGICSSFCFFLAAHRYPTALRSIWGHMAEELSDETWDELERPVGKANDLGLSMLLKMTRCHDLGLGQLFFPDQDLTAFPTTEKEEYERDRGRAMAKQNTPP